MPGTQLITWRSQLGTSSYTSRFVATGMGCVYVLQIL
jgi:hypothetical protein